MVLKQYVSVVIAHYQIVLCDDVANKLRLNRFSGYSSTSYLCMCPCTGRCSCKRFLYCVLQRVDVPVILTLLILTNMTGNTL